MAPDPLEAETFKCSASVGLGVSGAPPVAYVSAVRSDVHATYERVSVEFANGQPRDVVVSIQQGSTFLPEGTGAQPIALNGQAGALMTFHGTDGHTDYHGPIDLKTKSSTVLELRRILDSGGTVQWAVGLSKVSCYRVAFYSDPIRLVVDFQA